MKGLKCIKLLILSTIFLPLFGICSNTSALKYEITRFPIAFPNSIGTALSPSDYFMIQFDDSSYVPSIFYHPYYAPSNNNNGSNCLFPNNYNYHNIYSFGSSNDIYARFPYFDSRFTYADDSNYLDKFKQCMLLDGVPESLSSGLSASINFYAPIDDIAYYHSFEPYWYPYAFLTASRCNSYDGLHICDKLDLANIFESVPSSSFGHIKSLQIPLGYPDIEFAQYDHLHFEFESDLDSDSDSTANFDYSNLGIRLNIQYNRSVFENSTCSVSLIDRRVSDPDLYPYTLKYSCDYDFNTLPQNFDFHKVSFRLQFYRLDSSSTAPSSIFDYPADTFTFYASFLVTNYDETPADRDFVVLPDTPSQYLSPGNPSSVSDGDTSNVNWFSSLTNLFNFNIINPFQPIFDMFSGNIDVNNERCASIPTIAGMLNSPESVVCPFFPASIRSIGTSVLGLASTMLIFGFFVHWLGSSSGNNIEDSSTHSWGRFNVKKGGKS